MSDMRVKDLAGTVGISAERLVEQLNEAGIVVSAADDLITEEQKTTLLKFLQQRHGKSSESAASAPKKITLKRKSVSEIKLSGATRGGKSVSVEVRKKRTYVKRSEADESAATELLKQKTAQEHAAQETSQEHKHLEAANKKQEVQPPQKSIEEDETAQVTAAIEAEKQAAEEVRLAAEEEQKAIEAEKTTDGTGKKAKKATGKDKSTPAQLAHKKLAEADAKRRAANLARIEAEKALKSKRKAREKEAELEKEREKANVAAAQAQANEQKSAARKHKDADGKHGKDKAGRRGGRRHDDEFEREELHVSENQIRPP